MTENKLHIVDTLLSEKPWKKDSPFDTFDKWKPFFFKKISGLKHAMDKAVKGGFYV